MSEKYFYAADGQREGPFELSALQDLALKGNLRRSHLVWKKGMSGWQKAGEVSDIFGDLPPDLDPLPPNNSEPPSLPVRPSVPLEKHLETKTALPPANANQEALWTVSTEVHDARGRFMSAERKTFIGLFPIAIISQAMLMGHSDDLIFGIAALLGGISLILAYYHWMKVHYHMWKL